MVAARPDMGDRNSRRAHRFRSHATGEALSAQILLHAPRTHARSTENFDSRIFRVGEFASG